jgi:nucleoside-diphosphate-sugar epimerase
MTRGACQREGMPLSGVEAPGMSRKRLRVLLTGAGGRIGPHILPTFREAFDLRLLDRNPVPGPEPTVLTDLSDPEILREAMQEIDVVVHLAATSDEAPFVEELVPNNVVGLYHILESARIAGVRRVVFASTVQAVGFYPAGTTIAASDAPRPVTLYGCTKALGETMGRHYHDKHQLEFIAVRIGWFLDYEAPQLRRYQGARDIWLSPRDAAGILAASVTTPNIGYAIVNATSRTDFERLSRRECREILGYDAVDSIEDIPFEPDKNN